jgi:transposase
MRGRTSKQPPMFLMINVDAELADDHPLRAIKRRADHILATMSRDFSEAYSKTGRPSIPPEQLLKAMLLRALYSIRSEIQLTQAIHFNLLYRWFLDLHDAPVWTPEVFSINRKRFEDHGLVRTFFDRIVAEAVIEKLASPDHFSVDGTLIQSWASLKSMKRRDGADSHGNDSDRDDSDRGNPDVNWRGEKRSNETHVSASDPEALLARKGKGKEALLCHSGHVLMENRHGLCLDVRVDAADGTAERRCAQAMLKHVRQRHKLRPRTLGADKGFDDGAFLSEIERQGIRPHVAIRECKIVARDASGQARRRARERMKTKGYALSQRVRKRIEEILGWMKTVGGLARARWVGRWKIAQNALMTGAAYNLLRMARLETVP